MTSSGTRQGVQLSLHNNIIYIWWTQCNLSVDNNRPLDILAVFGIWSPISIIYLPYAAPQSEKAVTAYFESNQLLTFVFVYDDIKVKFDRSSQSSSGGICDHTITSKLIFTIHLSPQLWYPVDQLYLWREKIFLLKWASNLQLSCSVPSNHGAFIQCCFNVGPASQTMGQH